jgi:hypothetical protein
MPFDAYIATFTDISFLDCVKIEPNGSKFLLNVIDSALMIEA